MRSRVLWYGDGFDDVEEDVGLFYGGAARDMWGLWTHNGGKGRSREGFGEWLWDVLPGPVVLPLRLKLKLALMLSICQDKNDTGNHR